MQARHPDMIPVRPLSLSQEETRWVESREKLRVAYTADWPPFSFVTASGEEQGIDIEMVRRFGQAVGLEIEFVTADTWETIYQMGVDGRIDVITGMAATPERRRHFEFTRPYLSFPVAIIRQEHRPLVLSLDGLKDNVFALPEQYVTTLQFQQDYPDHSVVLTASSTESLQKVSRGEADATLENMAVATHIIRSEGFTNLQISGVSDYRFDLCLGIPRGNPVLTSLLNRYLEEMNQDEIQHILSHWVPVQVEDWIIWENVWPRFRQVALMVLAVILVILIWNVRLSREVRARIEAQNQLEEMINKRGEMLTWIAHDLRSPLGAIQLYLDQVRLDAGRQGKKPDETVDLVYGSVSQINHLADRLRQLQDAETGQLEIRTEPVHLSQLFERRIETHQLYANQKQIKVLSELPEDDLTLHSDPDIVAQILDNLLTNAIKFSPPGKTVRLKGSRSGHQVRIDVEDEGVGIPEDEISRVFEPYARISSQPTAGESSTGLGLIIVKALVGRLGGTAEVESTLARGSLFTVELPDR